MVAIDLLNHGFLELLDLPLDGMNDSLEFIGLLVDLFFISEDQYLEVLHPVEAQAYLLDEVLHYHEVLLVDVRSVLGLDCQTLSHNLLVALANHCNQEVTENEE